MSSDIQAVTEELHSINLPKSTLSSLEDCPLLPVLHLDPRPTFVVLDSPSPVTASSSLLFINKALDSLSKLTLEIRTSLREAQSCLDLLRDISATGEARLAATRARPAFSQRCWISYTIGDSWRVFSADSYVLPQPESHTASDDSITNRKRRRKSMVDTYHSVLPRDIDTNFSHPPILKVLSESSPYNALVCSHDWSQTSLGPIQAWPREHLEFLAQILNDPQPAMILLGHEYVTVHNELAHSILEARNGTFDHGMTPAKMQNRWTKGYKDALSSVWHTGKGITIENIANPPSKQLAELYLTLTCTPIYNTDKACTTGLHMGLKDVTQDMLRNRRQDTLMALSAEVVHDSLRAVFSHFISCLHSRDVPQALLYSKDSTTGSTVCCLQDSVSWHSKSGTNFEQFALNDPDHVLAGLFRIALTEKEPHYTAVEDVPQEILAGLVGDRGFKDPCKSIAFMPIRLAANQSNMGFMMLALGTRQPYDDHYKAYIMALQRTLAASIEAHSHGASELELSKRTKIAQDKAELRFTRFSHHTSIGLCIYNPDGSLSFANEQWWRMTGFNSDMDTEAPGWWAPAVQPDDLPIAFAQFSKLLHDKLPVTFEIRYTKTSSYRAPDGDAYLPTWMLVSAYPELSDTQELDFVVACFTDITEQKFLVEVERKRSEDAIEARRQQESFVDITSHEIRNPLSAVLQCSQEISTILHEYTQTGNDHVGVSVKDIRDVISAAETIEHCTLHQKGLVDDILTLSKMDAGLLPVSCELAKPDVVAKKTFAFFARELNQIAIQTSLVIDPSYTELGIDRLQFDAGRVSQILVNLLTNAIKFTKAAVKREIELRVGATKYASIDLFPLNYLPVGSHKITAAGANWPDEDCIYLHFSVHDTGLGMNAEEQNNLFQRFSQGSTKTYTQYGGSGLGLFIARALVEIHGGQIGFRSLKGQGSQFGFYIKTRRAVPVKIPAQLLPERSTTTAGTYDLLIVEDNLINQKVLSRQLLRHGHRVRIANHGEEALEILRRSSFCVDGGEALSCMLMDIEMPIMDGYTCTKAIRALQDSGEVRGHVPILATTGNARDEKVQLARDAGMDDVVLKPFTIDQLIPLIRSLIHEYGGVKNEKK